VVSGRARYTYSNRHPRGRAGAKLADETPRSSIVISSPGSTSRTNVAPMMSSAAVSLATAQPRSSRPSTSGRKPCGSRAAYKVCSSMKTSENAPRARGSAASALSATLALRGSANSAVSTSVSDVLTGPRQSAAAASTMAASSSVLMRLPL